MDNWHQIVESNIAWLVPSVRRIVGNDHDAEDVVQEVFAEAYSLAKKTKVKNWSGLLRTMAHRRAIDQLRRKTRARTTTSDQLYLISSDNDSAVEACDTNDLQNLLRHSLCKLSDREAAVFSLTYFDGLKRQEIAASLEVSENAVSVALHKAIKKLKAILHGSAEVKEN